MYRSHIRRMENHSSELGLAGAFGAEVTLEVLTVVRIE